MRKQLSRIDYKILFIFYPLLFVLCYLQAHAYVQPYYFPSEGIMGWPLRLMAIFVGIKAFMMHYKRHPLMSLYILYLFLTIIPYILFARPIELYVISVAFFIMPMTFFYIGLDNSDFKGSFEKSLFISCICLFVVGFYLYFFRPEWYEVATTASYNEYQVGQEIRQEDWVAEHLRFGSVMLDSYAISYFSMFTLPYAMFKYSLSKTKKTRWIYMAGIIICFVSGILCQQRVAMACVIAVLFFFVFMRNKKYFFFLSFITVCFIFAVIIFIEANQDDIIVGLISSRFEKMSLSEAFNTNSVSNTRVSQVVDTMNALENWLTGEGTGYGGGKARRMGLVGVSDVNYVRLLYEEGMVGLAMFLMIIIPAVIRGAKNIRYLFKETIIVICILAAMMVADPLDYFFYIPPFWYACGRIYNKQYLNYLKTNNLHI